MRPTLTTLALLVATTFAAAHAGEPTPAPAQVPGTPGKADLKAQRQQEIEKLLQKKRATQVNKAKARANQAQQRRQDQERVAPIVAQQQQQQALMQIEAQKAAAMQQMANAAAAQAQAAANQARIQSQVLGVPQIPTANGFQPYPYSIAPYGIPVRQVP